MRDHCEELEEITETIVVGVKCDNKPLRHTIFKEIPATNNKSLRDC